MELSKHCDEFLVHGVDVEGLQSGIEEKLDEECMLTPRCFSHPAVSLVDETWQISRIRLDCTTDFSIPVHVRVCVLRVGVVQAHSSVATDSDKNLMLLRNSIYLPFAVEVDTVCVCSSLPTANIRKTPGRSLWCKSWPCLPSQ